jgi:hypothetical protein
MESDSQRAQNKKSLLSIGVLMLSLAALQGPLFRAQQAASPIAVRSGGATLLTMDRPIAEIQLDRTHQATAEVVGEREVLVRGKALGETHLRVLLKDGRSNIYRVVVESESARSMWGTLQSR